MKATYSNPEPATLYSSHLKFVQLFWHWRMLWYRCITRRIGVSVFFSFIYR